MGPFYLINIVGFSPFEIAVMPGWHSSVQIGLCWALGCVSRLLAERFPGPALAYLRNPEPQGNQAGQQRGLCPGKNFLRVSSVHTLTSPSVRKAPQMNKHKSDTPLLLLLFRAVLGSSRYKDFPYSSCLPSGTASPWSKSSTEAVHL